MLFQDGDFMVEGFSTSAMRNVFSSRARLSSWLSVESAVATSQGDLGVIPRTAAEAIAFEISRLSLDQSRLAEDYRRIGFPVLPLVSQIVSNLDEASAQWVHHGLTTQDVVDTGLVLQIRSGVEIVEADLRAIIKGLSRLTKEHRDTVMAGRTFQQFASPMTFGYKTAVWLDELIRHWERLEDLKDRVFVGQGFGAVGTNAAGGPRAMEVQELAMGRLGLGVAETSWHSSRDRLAEMVAWLALACSTLGKIAGEVSTLMRSEVGELREALISGEGASSAMPQKANPVLSPRIIALATKIQELPSSMYRSMMQEHERGVSAMPLEWLTVPEAFLLASGCFSQSRQLVETLVVDGAKMEKNLELDNGFIMAEAVLGGLTSRLGRVEAKKIVAMALEYGRSHDVRFLEALVAATVDNESVDEALLSELCTPRNFLGHSHEMVDSQVRKATRLLGSES